MGEGFSCCHINKITIIKSRVEFYNTTICVHATATNPAGMDLQEEAGVDGKVQNHNGKVVL